MTEAFVALGSNLGDARAQVQEAFAALARLPDTRLLAQSPLYLTPPWGVLDQPPFVNAVARLDTTLSPHALLDALLAIERAAGRVRDGQRWGPRILDLDVLYMDGVSLSDERLQLPHPRIGERAFVLLPLNDLAPSLELPGQGRVADLLARVDTTGLERLP
ncbi:2-amino-4-hydroxy-6-hydroxymethyldihydropteridine diphosphokinase [Dyella solisilvae]|uniref:2-amino-4-hydroxy-6-hydroxymethyldihydropteridine pyrophosphokinase n=1 Tax=Dyella solisilvae TaxID=1920168 RepID=A0A370KBF9_9GAMM|nr:2-amino-4-hydroxy-6-hydroxymethyldihydropteridine diphosphokinase [Dyella solisilvae]RDI99787.1 2-amino-4-hydroxy-6-hydroxymethyldihydropteridine diphosphokinase [Dyella solisilvae]